MNIALGRYVALVGQVTEIELRYFSLFFLTPHSWTPARIRGRLRSFHDLKDIKSISTKCHDRDQTC
jgi:hypothetical protein